MTTVTEPTDAPDMPARPAAEPLLPELRSAWWESGMRARADAGDSRGTGGVAALGEGRGHYQLAGGPN